MIRLRTFVILSSLLVVGLAIVVSWSQMKSTLERGGIALEAKELEHISQVIRTVVETKKSELKNYTQMIRSNNDLSSAYLTAKESGDIELLDSKLEKIKREIRFDFAEILTPDGKTIHSSALDAGPEVLKRISQESAGLFSAILFGKPALVSFSPLTLYEEPIGTFVIAYFLEGDLSRDLSKLTNADVSFKIVAPSSASEAKFEDLAHGQLSFDIDGTALNPLWASIRLRENPADSVWKLFSSRLILSAIISLGLLLLALYSFLEFGFIRDFRNFVSDIEKVGHDVDRGEPRELPPGTSYIYESHLLFKTTRALVTSLIAYQTRTKKQVLLEEAARKQKALGELASQVAHDIRSPLAALVMSTSTLVQVPEQNRLLIRRAVSRIQDIANNLLLKRKEIENDNPLVTAVPEEALDQQSLQLLSSLIENIISEKRMQIRQRMDVQIESKLGNDSYGLFANVQSTTFKTIISNLLDNSVEAIKTSGNIFVYLRQEGNQIRILIEDNGIGISPEILPKLAQRGNSFNKKNGSGLGLYHAKVNFKSWEGQLNIKSKLEVGTSVELTLPAAQPPAWFVPSISLEGINTIIVVDDDVSIHQIWAKRFERLKESQSTTVVLNFSTPQQLLKWKYFEATPENNVLYLIDYEFIGG